MCATLIGEVAHCDEDILKRFEMITACLVSTIKQNDRHSAQLVAGGHLTDVRHTDQKVHTQMQFCHRNLGFAHSSQNQMVCWKNAQWALEVVVLKQRLHVQMVCKMSTHHQINIAMSPTRNWHFVATHCCILFLASLFD